MGFFDKLKDIAGQAESGVGKIKLSLFVKKLGLADGVADMLIRDCPKIKLLVENNNTSEADIIWWAGTFWQQNKHYRNGENREIPEGVEESLRFCHYIRHGMAKGILPLPADSTLRDMLGLVSPLEENHR